MTTITNRTASLMQQQNLQPTPTPQPVTGPHPMFRALRIASTGLSAQRARLEVAAENIANAETTRTPEGGPYRRKSVILESMSVIPQGALDPNIADASKGVASVPSL